MSEHVEIESEHEAKYVTCSTIGDSIGFVVELDNGKHVMVHAPTDVVMDSVIRAQRARMGGEP